MEIRASRKGGTSAGFRGSEDLGRLSRMSVPGGHTMIIGTEVGKEPYLVLVGH